MSLGTTVAPGGVVGQNSPLMDEEAEEKFIEFSSDVAHTFVELFLLKEMDDIIKRSPETKATKKTLVFGSEEEVLAATQDEVAYEVAQRLKALGDKINDELIQTELMDALTKLHQNESIWDFNYPKFHGLMQNVLGKCSDVFKTGWDQVAVIYTTVANLVGELRVQQDERGGLREKQMEGYAGAYMRDSGIQEWIQAQGGMVRISEVPKPDGPPKVHIPLETDV